MNIEAFELKKPGCETVYKLKLVNSVFYFWKNGKWQIKKFSDNGKGYYKSGFYFETKKKTGIYLHRLIYFAYNQSWDIFDNSDQNTIDHIQHQKHTPLNNHISNLRILSFHKQQFNKDVKGYGWNKERKKWRAYIMLNGRSKHLGYFNTEEEAKEAYENAKPHYHKINQDDD